MKPSLVILHGALGCKAQFNEWAEFLMDDFDCHLLEFNGHGTKSGNDLVFSIKEFSEELKIFIKQNQLKKPAILGYSMGGYVALYTAHYTEGLLGDIMTIATKFDWNIESAKKEAGYLQPQLMQQKVPQLADQLKQRHGESHWVTVVNRTAEMMLQLGANPPLTEENISSIKNRVKYCVGDKDKMVSISETLAMFKNTPLASFCVFPNTAHLPETMSPERIKFELQDFLLRK